MIKIEYPATKPRIKKEADKELIFCAVRKRWVSLTPEEWVRQNFLLYLTESLHYPWALLAVEKKLDLGTVQKRFDIVLYSTPTQPYMLIECKEMNVPLNADVLDQVLRYNIKIQAPLLVICNGLHCFAFKKEGNRFLTLTELPVNFF